MYKVPVMSVIYVDPEVFIIMYLRVLAKKIGISTASKFYRLKSLTH